MVKENPFTKGFEMIFNPAKAEEEYIKQKGRPLNLYLQLLGGICFMIFLIVIILLRDKYPFIISPGSIAILSVCFAMWIFHMFYYLKKTVSRRNKRHPTLDEKSLITSQQLSVVCPYCNNTFQILQQNKPFRVKCPKCGKVSLLR